MGKTNEKMTIKAFPYIVVCTLVGMTLAMCGKHGGADEPLLMDSVVMDTSTVVGKNNGARYHLDLNVKTLAEPQYRKLNIALIDSLLTPNIIDLYDTAGVTPRQRIEQYVRSNFSAYKAFYGAVYDEEPHAGTAFSDYRLTTEMRRNDEGLVNYIGRMETVLNNQQTDYSIALNIDLEQQRILSLQDVVDNASSESLIQQIVEQLCKQTGSSDLSSLQGKGYFTHTPPYAPDNFILGSDDITFIYVPGEIADREKGEVRVVVDR